MQHKIQTWKHLKSRCCKKVRLKSTNFFSVLEANSFRWTSNIPDGDKIYACENKSLTLPWKFSVEDKEKLEDIKWDYDFNGTREDIANFVNGHFAVVSDSFMGRLNYVPREGLELTSTTAEDSGTYTIHVLILENSTTYIQYRSSLTLDITDGKPGLPFFCLVIVGVFWKLAIVVPLPLQHMYVWERERLLWPMTITADQLITYQCQ